MAAVKDGSRSTQNRVVATTGVVLEIDERLVALVRLHAGNHVRIRADMMPGKSAPPLPGETWILDQRHGIGWQFATPYAWSADRDWLAPVLTSPWTAPSGSWLAVGYQRAPDGWTRLCGRLSGGTAGSTAFVLPPGYRPGGDWLQLVPAGSGSGQLLVTAAGAVQPQTATFPVSLDGVTFMAAG